ncbi:SGNH/GDSL hydrolase family protein [Hymenobacter psychrotolerans]|uniref:GDSL-like Lipase/Acylhydrolase n=1 Tax=Hymenobacter psychrotolerans DSM 18569 TaxID=1121959 RepID=A0A1M6PF00_9BACT|nr:SGNH/GDSL hydrolase family protein [Hymenobacter psychrotolerans]SHK06523.1 GDSL-like Lipase/Acylhydrolase [Hymenobacter psychrotolerans DSM 18569]
MYTLLKRTAPALALLGLGLAGCQPELDAPGADKGSADFSRYIAVGNSLTAGYGDNGLYLEGQLASYPNLLAEQFKTVGGGDFAQPLFNQPNQENGSGYLRLTGFTATGNPITANVTTNLAVRAITPQALYTRYDAPVNNLGVPGIKLADIQTPGYGSQVGNAYFERITPAANPLQTYFQRVKAEAATATFFTCWLGNNDVLGYATAGGALGPTAITRTDTFQLKANRIINVLTANGAKGVVATIPNVTNVPFFTTVRVAAIKATFKASNQALSLYIQTSAGVREATDADLLTLTSSSVIGTATSGNPFPVGAGISPTAANPLPSQFVLDASEQTLVRDATTAYNTALTAKANEKGLAVFDANAFFARIAATGIVSDAVNNTAAFISGNLFSLDGVHPTPRGYAVIANEMISAINSKYGSSLSQVNPNNYRGVRFP